MWTMSAVGPWDLHLAEEGRVRVFCTGWKIRNALGFPIHHVSSFHLFSVASRRVVCALCADDDDPNNLSSKDVSSIDPSKLKVSIAFGLCEMLNGQAIRANAAPKDGNFGFNGSELQAMLPVGMVDTSVTRVYEEVNTLHVHLASKWEESAYAQIIKAVYEVDYCAYVEL